MRRHCRLRPTVIDEQHQHHQPQGKKPLVHVATTERRIRFKEVELKPKGEGAAPDAVASSTSKSSTAKKVKTQMDHVMGTQAGSSRRGRGGKKRGGTTKSQSQAQTRSSGKARAPDAPAEADVPPQTEPSEFALDPALAQADPTES